MAAAARGERPVSQQENDAMLQASLRDCFNVQALVDAIETKDPSLTSVIIDSGRDQFPIRIPKPVLQPYIPTAHKASSIILHRTSYGLEAWEDYNATNGLLVKHFTHGGALRSGMYVQQLFQKAVEGVRGYLQSHGMTQVPELTHTLSDHRSLLDDIVARQPHSNDLHLPCRMLDRAEVFRVLDDKRIRTLPPGMRPVISRPITNVVVANGRQPVVGNLETLRCPTARQLPLNLDDPRHVLTVEVQPLLSNYFERYDYGPKDLAALRVHLLPYALCAACVRTYDFVDRGDARMPYLPIFLANNPPEVMRAPANRSSRQLNSSNTSLIYPHAEEDEDVHASAPEAYRNSGFETIFEDPASMMNTAAHASSASSEPIDESANQDQPFYPSVVFRSESRTAATTTTNLMAVSPRNRTSCPGIDTLTRRPCEDEDVQANEDARRALWAETSLQWREENMDS